jgi:hypothetical protein
MRGDLEALALALQCLLDVWPQPFIYGRFEDLTGVPAQNLGKRPLEPFLVQPVREAVALIPIDVGNEHRQIVGDQAKLVPIFAQRLLGAFALADVAKHAQDRVLAPVHDGRGGCLDVEHAPVQADIELLHRRRGSGLFGGVLGAFPDGILEVRMNEVQDRPADEVVVGAGAEQADGSRIGEGDLSVDIDEDAGGRLLDEPAIALLAFAEFSGFFLYAQFQ